MKILNGNFQNVQTAWTKHAGSATDWGSASTHLVPSVYTLQNHV